MIPRSKIILPTILLFLLPLSLAGQGEELATKWNIKFGYARYKTGNLVASSNSLGEGSMTNEEMMEEIDKLMKAQIVSNFRLEWNYKHTETIEAGFYLGYANIGMYSYQSLTDNIVPSFGGNFNYHLLPLFLESKDLRFDVYATAKVGLFYVGLIEPMYQDRYQHKIYGEYGAGVGVSYYLSSRFGVYAEYCVGKFHIRSIDKRSDDHTKLRYGLTWKF